MPIGVHTDEWLQYGGGQLVGQRDEADLRKTQLKIAFQERIYRQNERLNHVVQKVREADRSQHIKSRRLVNRQNGRWRGIRQHRVGDPAPSETYRIARDVTKAGVP